VSGTWAQARALREVHQPGLADGPDRLEQVEGPRQRLHGGPLNLTIFDVSVFRHTESV